MAKMYSKGRGSSKSTRPYIATKPEWVSLSNKEIEEKIVELAKKGHTESQIGCYLRDELGIPYIKTLLHESLSGILKRNGLLPEIPENLLNLIKRNKTMKDHFLKNKKDKVAKFNLNRNESKIYRLIRWLKKTGRLSDKFKFDKTTINQIVNG